MQIHKNLHQILSKTVLKQRKKSVFSCSTVQDEVTGTVTSVEAHFVFQQSKQKTKQNYCNLNKDTLRL